jgi:hypothetical protein
MRRLRDLLQALGPVGIAATGVLLFCAAFAVSALLPAERELKVLRAAAASRAALAADSSAGNAQRGEAYGHFYDRFPPLDKLPDELERLYRLASAAKLDVPRGDYRLEDRGAPLAAYRITLPLHGTYPRIRAFIAGVLQAMPTLAIDALRFERKQSDDPEIDAQLRLTAYFRTTNEDSSP